MTAPSNANTSGLAPTDALRLVQELRLAACGLFTLKNETGDYGYFDTLADRVEALAAAPASPLPGGALPADVVRLVIAARMVAFDRVSAATIAELDAASEAFASRVPWDNAPDELHAAPTGEPK